jgi:diguanylate cyclase (GGDEF)-like protein
VAGYTEVHARFLESLAGFITVALRNGLNHRKIQRLNRQMRLLARTDQLTGLANRRALSEFLERTISYSRRHAQSFAVLFFDLDGFKPINDNWGHAAGDHVLTQLAQRLGAAVREHDLVARVGGDEFIAVALGVGDRANAEALAEKVLSAVAEPVVWLERELTVGASIGLALYPEHGASADILVTTADNAMYRAKNTGKHRFDWATKPGA